MLNEIFNSLVYRPPVFIVGFVVSILAFYGLLNLNLFLFYRCSKSRWAPATITTVVLFVVLLFGCMCAIFDCDGEECLAVPFLVYYSLFIILGNFILQFLVTNIYAKRNTSYKGVLKFSIPFFVLLASLLLIIGVTWRVRYPFPRESHADWFKVAAEQNDPNVCLDNMKGAENISLCLNKASIATGNIDFCNSMDRVVATDRKQVYPKEECISQLQMRWNYMKDECKIDFYDINCLKQFQACKSIEYGYCNMVYVYRARAMNEKRPEFCDKIKSVYFFESQKKDCYNVAKQN